MKASEHEIMRAVEERYWWYLALRRHVADEIATTSARRVLDAGCGTGGMLKVLRERFPDMQLVGADQSAHALELTGQRHLVAPLVQADVARLPFRDAEFDCVLSIDVITAASVEAGEAMREMHRVLAPGGRLILNAAALQWLAGAHDAAVDVNRRFTRAELVRLLRETGFDAIHATYWNMCLLPVVATMRWLSRNQPTARSDFRPLPGFLNAALEQLALAELRLSRFCSLPFGSSVFAVARRR
jgi:ubiquinone/menaquinone biosynthesis C-methylase UbiE